MITIDKLKEYGANVEEGLSRCMGNEALYLKLVATIPNEPRFAELNKNIAENNLDSAFEAAHALKGVLGNLALTPLYDPVFEITELLRTREPADYTDILSKINEKVETLSDLCS